MVLIVFAMLSIKEIMQFRLLQYQAPLGLLEIQADSLQAIAEQPIVDSEVDFPIDSTSSIVPTTVSTNGPTISTVPTTVSTNGLTISTVPTTVSTNGPTIVQTTDLRPAELAYLIRGGDITHTIIVMVVDLLQRILKGNIQLAAYELNISKVVKQSIKDWADKKIDSVVPKNITKDPIGQVKKLIFLYNWIRNSLKGLIAETLRDPRHLRKYLNVNGLLRLLAELSVSGYKESVRRDLRQNLLARGLIVPEDRRTKYGVLQRVLAVIASIGALVVTWVVVNNAPIAIFVCMTSLVVAAATHTMLFLKQLIPLYIEIVELVSSIDRQSWRLTVIKTVLQIFTMCFWLITCALIGSLLLISFVILTLATPATATTAILMVFSLSLAQISCFEAYLSGWKLTVQEQPTRLAIKEIDRARARLAPVSPLESFKAVLASPDYDPQFSQLLAIYGIEMFVILG